MRTLGPELTARLNSGAAALCHAWIVRPEGRAPEGFTDHDRPLLVDGVECRPQAGWRAGSIETQLGTAPGQAAVDGVLGDGGPEEADILDGAYDGARVDLYRVDWARPELMARLWSGRLARLKRRGDALEAELEGPMAALERVVGRTYGRRCDAALGDARCGVEAAGRTCDKRFQTCVGVFANGVNFQGFPDLPGEDFLTAHPAGASRNDGRSRR